MKYEKISLIIGGTIAAIFMVLLVIKEISNPDMTQMRMLLTYWKLYVGIFSGFGIILLGMFLGNKE